MAKLGGVGLFGGFWAFVLVNVTVLLVAIGCGFGGGIVIVLLRGRGCGVWGVGGRCRLLVASVRQRGATSILAMSSVCKSETLAFGLAAPLTLLFVGQKVT